MAWWGIGIGCLLGLWLGLGPLETAPGLFGILLGGVCGFLWSQVIRQGRRLDRLESLLVSMPEQTPPLPEALPQAQAKAAAAKASPGPVEVPTGVPAPGLEPSAPLASTLVSAPPAAPSGGPPKGPWAPWEKVKRWFGEGNVPVKVGVVVLFAGVGALLKYASDEGWLSLPIELRLVGVSLAATAALVFGFSQRSARRSFGLSVQGGAIGILSLTIFAAFRLYGLLPALPAFGLLVVLVMGTGCLAVVQHSLSLAVLGTLAGFLAPILTSDGSGNHVVLFTWYALLNAGIFFVAAFRSFRLLNLLGFFCTFGVSAAWGVLRYDPAHFASTEPFLILFFAFYLLIPFFYAARGKEAPRGLVDGTLVFGTPLFTFGFQAILVEGAALPLAITALSIAAIHLSVAALLRKKEGLELLSGSHAALAVGFATLTVPLALSGRVTASLFALEGAALVWLGLRQGRRLPRWSGLFLQVLASAIWLSAGSDPHQEIPLANGLFLGATLVSLASLTTAWLYWKEPDRKPGTVVLSSILCLWGVASGLGGALGEIERFVPNGFRPDCWLAVFALYGWLASRAFRRLKAPLLSWIGALCLAAAVPILGIQTLVHSQPFGGLGLPAWILFAALGIDSLRSSSESSRASLILSQSAWSWAWTLALSLALSEGVGRTGIGSSWRAIGLPLLVIHALTLLRPAWIAWPLASRLAETRAFLLNGQALVLALGVLGSFFFPGDSSPLPWIPLLNPQELPGLVHLLLFALWLSDRDAPPFLSRRRQILLAGWGFCLVTVATLRAVHHFGWEPWNASLLWGSSTQTGLSVVWSLIGVAAWVAGSRKGNRPLWLAGAVLMGVVLIKLGLIDRQHLGNLTGIVSFLAYGILCTVVGYLAPAPVGKSPSPREGSDTLDLGPQR